VGQQSIYDRRTERRERNKRNRRVILTALSAVVTVSFVAAALVSQLYWGYVFYRPAPDRRIGRLETVHSVTQVVTERGADGASAFVAVEDQSLDSRLEVCRPGEFRASYYCLSERILAALDAREILPDEPLMMPTQELDLVYGLVEATGLVREGTPGYGRAKLLRGVVVEASDADGVRYMIVAVIGGEVSNDHYPYYEFLFEQPAGDAPELCSSRRFYFDVAGIEGLEWRVIWLAFFVLGLVLLLIAGLVVFSVRRARARRGGSEASG